jgi:plastocyanin
MELEPQEHSFFSTSGKVILPIFVVVALVLSYFLYQKVQYGATPYAEPQDTPADTTNTDARSSDEQTVLKLPSGDASPEARAAHFTAVQKIAVDTTELSIGANCKVSPVVLKTKMGTKLSFKNTDTAEHTIVFSATLSFPVPANQSITVPATFGKVAGLYGYNCDQVGLAGMIWME